MITRKRSLFENGLTGKELGDAVSEHARGLERYSRLRRYYLGRTDILDRRRAAGLPNNRVAHAFARYIVTVTAGYLVGEKVRYEGGGGLQAAVKALEKANAASVDVENARNAAIYGRGVELMALSENGEPAVYALSPESAFVVYDDTIEHKPLFGVYLTDGQALTVTDEVTQMWEKAGGEWVCVSAEPHFFGGVPMVEYWNDENERGDFEWVMPLIDAYDRLQSDRVNDKEQFADKLLVLTGCTLETDENGREPWLQLRMDKALCLPDGEAKAQYLSAQMDESGNEILRKSLENDLHKLALVPDISDISFSGNSSGVAMRYKLLALEQLAGMKQQWFEEGLRMRLGLISNYMELRGYPPVDLSGVKVVFTRRLPQAEE